MANQHITAALVCSEFKGITRLVLFVLADAASPGPKKQNAEEKKKVLPFGYCKRKRSTLMMLTNCHRPQTISKALAELKEAGAIKQFRKKHSSALYFVDLEWLQDHAVEDKTVRKALPQDTRKPSGLHGDCNGSDEGVEVEQRKPLPLDEQNNGKRNLLKTESDTSKTTETATTVIPSLFPPEQKTFGNSSHRRAGEVFPTATRETSITNHASQETFGQTQGTSSPGPQIPFPITDDEGSDVPPVPQSAPKVPTPTFRAAPPAKPKRPATPDECFHYFDDKGTCIEKCGATNWGRDVANAI